MNVRILRGVSLLGLTGVWNLSYAWAQAPEAKAPAVAPPSVAAFKGPPGTGWNEASVRKISIPLQQVSTSDYLLSMARAADANFLIDATEMEPQSPPLSGRWQHFTSASDGQNWEGIIIGPLFALAHERSLTLQMFPTRTFLVWSEPDMARLGQAVADALPELQASHSNWMTASRRREPLRRALVKYLMDDLRWDGETPREVPLSRLPLALQKQVRSVLLAPDDVLPTSANDQVWFRDEFWRGAVLHIPNSGVAAPDASKIQITGIAARDERGFVVSSRHLSYPSGAVSSRIDLPQNALATLAPAPAANAAVNGVEAAQGAEAAALFEEPDLQGGAALQKELSFEFSRRPLREVIEASNRQSEAKITVGDGVEARLLSVHAARMPQWEWMLRLRDLLGVRWQKTGDNAFTMHPPLRAVDALQVRLGNPACTATGTSGRAPTGGFASAVEPGGGSGRCAGDSARDRRRPRHRAPAAVPAHRKELVDDLSDGQIGYGIPVSELAPEQAALLRRHVAAHVAPNLVTDYRRYRAPRRVRAGA
jgi:hypothetical protein